MNKFSTTGQRKNDHIRITLEENVDSGLRTGLENFRFRHCAIPEFDLAKIDTSTKLFGKVISLPFLISSMTGGTKDAIRINKTLAICAEEFNLAMGVGSQRAGIEDASAMQTFKVREFAPNILLFANLGAIQLNNNYTLEHCMRIIDSIEADALILHLNPLQEALMENGDTNFEGLLSKIELICKRLPVPVIAKEVGWGISPEVAKMLINSGVQAIDVAGAGGTSWSEVEKHRMKTEEQKEIAASYKHWGIPTADCIYGIHQDLPQVKLIASGGLKDGIDIAKCIALGASIGGMARQFLLAAAESKKMLSKRILILKRQFEIAMFAVGAENISELQDNKIFRID